MRGTKKARYAEYTGKKMWLVEHPNARCVRLEEDICQGHDTS